MILSNGKIWSALILSLFLSACGEREGLAPVVELNWHAAKSMRALSHVVVRGETLYAIAFHYDLDYRQLAVINHLSSPYTLRVGQVLRIKGQSAVLTQPGHRATQSPRVSNQRTSPVYHYQPPAPPPVRQTANPKNGRWLWPVYGRIVSSFMPQLGKKGIDIAGKKGDMIHAASGGVVAYAGSGISGYGNLIIIKHNNQYLTAYGNNLRNLVKEGQRIKAGQTIAEMGVVDRRFWGVHFEIRNAGVPVNPLNYLQKN